nr:MAG TPA: hypothetical protein [Caudoviricetes sp.]
MAPMFFSRTHRRIVHSLTPYVSATSFTLISFFTFSSPFAG